MPEENYKIITTPYNLLSKGPKEGRGTRDNEKAIWNNNLSHKKNNK
jgi:hypothetical protein